VSSFLDSRGYHSKVAVVVVVVVVAVAAVAVAIAAQTQKAASSPAVWYPFTSDGGSKRWRAPTKAADTMARTK
jgi:hypothetical protein